MTGASQEFAAMMEPIAAPEPTVGDILLRHFSTIGDLLPDDIAALRDIPARVLDVERYETVLAVGDRPDSVVVVLAGWLYRHNTSRDGKRQVQGFYMTEDAPCLETLHIARMDHVLAALTPARLGLIAHGDLKRVLDQRPNLLHLAWRDTLIVSSIYREWLNRNGRMDAVAALSHLFCEVMTRARAAGVAPGDACEFPATQEVIGEALALTAVHVNRTLQQLRQTGLVEFGGGRLVIHDFNRLADLGEFDPQYLHLRN